jgi:mannose-6-phosphate isomerase
MNEQAISFVPIYQQRVWGGRLLESDFGRSLADDGMPYGESWEVVDRPEAMSVVSEDHSSLAGVTLEFLWKNHRAQLFGANAPAAERFPLLSKILDCRKRLSLQVHPPAQVAAELGGEPKTEMWYVAAADEGAELYVGLREGVSRESFEASLLDGSAEQQVHQVAVKEGDFLFIPSGRLHAIGGGLVIYEIQQNSDTTYRVFDWNRVGLDGAPRQLHVEESLRCIDFSDVEPGADVADGEVLVDCEHFKVSRWEIAEGAARQPPGFSMIAVIDGSVSVGNRSFERGDFFVIPDDAARRGTLKLEASAGGVALLATEWPD